MRGVRVAIFGLFDGACGTLPEPWLIVDDFDFFAVNQLLACLACKFVVCVPPEMHVYGAESLAVSVGLVNSVDALNVSDA